MSIEDRRRKLNALPTPSAEVERLVTEIIGRVSSKWTMLLIEVLTEKGECRFGELTRACDGVSQKMLTQTLRAMERDGLITRTVFPVIPPKVVYALTELGLELSEAFCGVWLWAEANQARIQACRNQFDATASGARDDDQAGT